MAKYRYVKTQDVPVTMTFTAYELRRICEVLHREVENKGPERFFARTLHATLTETLTEVGISMQLESKFIANHIIRHLADGMNDAQEKAHAVEG